MKVTYVHMLLSVLCVCVIKMNSIKELNECFNIQALSLKYKITAA